MEKRHVGMGNAKEGFEGFSKKNILNIFGCVMLREDRWCEKKLTLQFSVHGGRGKFFKKKRNNFSPTRIIALTSRW